jgi:transcriptional regulator with XRE-family HTH domain
MPVPNNIQAMREERGWSRPALARLAGTSPQQIERLEKAQRRLSDVWLERIAQAFAVQPYELIAPASLLPTEEELAVMLLDSHAELPAGLPFAEWPRAVAAALHARLARLADDRSRASRAP